MSFYDKALPEGASGYFSQPDTGLDPNLFIGLDLKQDVRHWLMVTLVNGLRRYLDLTGADEWLHAWLAGSGITFQYGGDRGNGDLDVLFGVDMASFTRLNPEYHGLPEPYVADYADEILKQKLWPTTEHTTFGTQVYEVTFFWNPGTGSDITKIHPYAAYDLKADAWVVPPPALPDDPHTLYPSEWYQAAERDVNDAEAIARRYHTLRNQGPSIAADVSGMRNNAVELSNARAAARALFTSIHTGRSDAFGEQGHGYGDYANFRWQRAKATGVVAGLKNIMEAGRAEEEAQEQQMYGGPIDAPGKIITRDILQRGKHPYLR